MLKSKDNLIKEIKELVGKLPKDNEFNAHCNSIIERKRFFDFNLKNVKLNEQQINVGRWEMKTKDVAYEDLELYDLIMIHKQLKLYLGEV